MHLFFTLTVRAALGPMLIALDWFILIVLLGGLIRGYSVGAVRQVGSLIGIVAALLVSVEFMESVGAMVVSSLGLSASLAPLVGFTVLFLGVYLLFLAVSRLVEQVLSSLSLSLLNRAVGGAVGGFKAALLLSLLFLVLAGVQLPAQETRTKSALYRPVAQLLPKALEVSEGWVPAAQDAADKLGKRVRSKVEAVSGPSADSVSSLPPHIREARRNAPSRLLNVSLEPVLTRSIQPHGRTPKRHFD